MKRIFAWIIMSLMSITAVMPSFIPFTNQNETPSVVQVEKEEEKGNITPTVVPDEPTPEPEPKIEPVAFDDQDYVVKDGFGHYLTQNADFEEVPASDRNPNLPNDYTQITYISSTGVQWVDTGFVPTINTRVEIEFSYNKLGNYNSIGGIYLGNREITIEVEGKSLFTKFNTGSTWYVSNGAIIDHKYSLMLSNATRELDGTVYNDSKAGTWLYNTTYTYTLFGVKTWNGCSNLSSAKIYSFKLYDLDANNEEEKKLDFIPVITSDGVFGFFDIVGQTFYGNSGSGSFNLGNLQGDGTENTPYEISDAGELATMIAYSKPNAYYVLTNDISFNDGYFEPNDDGTCTYHDGGDGILYNWAGNIATSFKQFDGQNHTIKNFYSSTVGLFSSSAKCYISNLNMTGGYIETNRGTGFVLKNGGTFSEELINVRVDGVLYSTYSGSREGGGSGLIVGNENYARSILKNCVARGKVTAPSAGGIGRLTSGIFENCVNYADVNGGAYAGGILAACWHATPDITFTSCKNYGEITGTTNVAGITSGAVRAIFRNCVNYGKINSTNSIASGILATQMNGGNFDFYSCGNEGQITGKNGAAGICYNCGTYRTVKDCYNKGDILSNSTRYGLVNGAKFAADCFNYGSADGMFGGISQNGEIRDCKNYGKVVTGLVGTLENNAVMINCANKYQGSCTRGLVQTCSGKIYRSVNESNARYGLVETLNGTGGIYECESLGDSTCYIANKINAGGEVKNCHFKGESQRAVGTNNGTLTNIVYEGSTKQYYGSDFSAFFLTWKDARIGLISLESTGLYRGKLTEKYLYEHGFEPQDHAYRISEEESLERLNKYYTQLDYLESTGTQRIDTGVIPTNTMKFVLESNFTSGAMGSSVASSAKTIFDFRSSAVLIYGEGKSHTYTKRNQKQKFTIDYLNSKTSCDEDENSFVSTPNFGNSTFTIFTWHEGGYYYNTSGKLYSLKIYDNETLVRDFVPVMRKSDNVFGLYDKVEGKFYTNQGTGTFLGA